MTPISPATLEAPAPRIAELATGVLRDAKEVMRAEFALAKDELRSELRVLSRAAIGLALAVILFNGAILALSAAAILWFSEPATAALGAGLMLVLVSLIALVSALKALGSSTTRTSAERP